MSKTFEDRLEDLAVDLNEQSADLRTSTFMWFVSTAEIIDRYLVVENQRLFKLNRTKLNILNVLTTHGGTMTPTDLSKKVARSKHAITTAVDILVGEGLVRREGEGKDRRLRKVTITSKGLSFVKKLMPTRQAITSKIMSCFDEEASNGFGDYLKQLRQHVLKLVEEQGTSDEYAEE